MAKGGISVLIVDRPGAIRKELRERLQRLRTVTVREAQDGTEAFHLLALAPADVIFASVSAAPMGGIDLARRIRNGFVPAYFGMEPPKPTLPIYLFGDRLGDEMVRSCLDAGANAALPAATLPGRITTILRTVVRDMLNANAPADTLVVRTQVVEPCVIYHFFGILSPAHGEALTDTFGRIARQTQDFVGLEITRTGPMDDYGLGTLVLMNGVAERALKRLHVICERADKADVFRSMDINVMLPIFPSVMDFVTSCRQQRSDAGGVRLP